MATIVAGAARAFMQHPHVIESDDETAIGMAIDTAIIDTAITAAMDVLREAVEDFA